MVLGPKLADVKLWLIEWRRFGNPQFFWDPKTMSDRCPPGASWCGDDRSLWGSESRSSMCPPVGFQVAHHLPADFVHPVPEKGASGCQFRTWQPVFSCNSHGKDLAVCQNPIPLVDIKIAGKWMFIPLKMVLIGIDPYPFPRKCQLRRQVAASSFETNGFWIQIEPKLCIQIALCKLWIYMSHHDAAASETNSWVHQCFHSALARELQAQGCAVRGWSWWYWRPQWPGEIFFSWWLTYPSEKYEFISWDDDIPYGKTKAMCQTTNQIVLRGNRV